ncbi:MAG: hypothetical protein ACK5IN_07895 [Microbacterium sp.]|uniref:hypothetical protein n=1 Tax=Microbacterium sp. TaxID=51671 RepID=UPI003A886E5E
MNHSLSEHSEHHTGGRTFLHDSLRLLTDAHCADQHSGDTGRRIANHAFCTRLDITDDEHLPPTLAEPLPPSSAKHTTAATKARKRGLSDEQ